MLSPRLTNCPECANIPSLLKKIDCKLAELGNNLYNNVSYMLNKPVPANDILQLIGYRRILTHKYCNPNYVHEYSVAMIASRVIRLTLGCVSKCNEPERCLEDPCDITIVPNPTTTSTSTLPPSTTTSTSSTSSTTSTTTTAGPTTTTTSSSSTSTTTSTSTSTSSSTTTSTTTICQDCIEHDVTIGTQVWTGCNLDVTTYRNGDPIPEVTDQGAWNSLTTGAWCYYENTSSNGTTYGKLYNWHAVNDPRGLAPIGYHIPSDAEWTTLVNYLGGNNVAGGHLKEPGFCHWEDPNTDADNSSGFTGLPSGNRGLSLLNPFVGITLFTYFWTSTPYLGGADGYAYQLRYVDGTVVRGFFTVRNGFAVRLIKDTETTTTTSTSTSTSTTTSTTTSAPPSALDREGGYYYNGYNINDLHEIAPEGWHIPSTPEFIELLEYVSGDSISLICSAAIGNTAGGYLKSTSVGQTFSFISPNAGALDSVGFNVVATGAFSPVESNNVGERSAFWTSENSAFFDTSGNAVEFNFNNNQATITYKTNIAPCTFARTKTNAFQLRVVKDDLTGYPTDGSTGTVTDIDGNS